MVRVVKISPNLSLELLHPFTLIGPKGKNTLAHRITNYVLETIPQEIGVSKEELVEATINSWILTRLHFTCYTPGDYSLYAITLRPSEKEAWPENNV